MGKLPEERGGAVRLLEGLDYFRENPWEKPVVGWLPTSEGHGGLHNPRGFATLRVVQLKELDGRMVPLYDQTHMVEDPGAIVLVINDQGEVALTANWRSIGERQLPGDEPVGPGYVRKLNEGRHWAWLYDTLGMWSLEAPRGMPPAPSKDDPNAPLVDPARHILETAKLEAYEEAGLVIDPDEARIIGVTNANTTHFAHAQAVVVARAHARADAEPEDLEIIRGTHFYSPAELMELNKTGNFVDGLTLAGLALHMFDIGCKLV